MFPLKVKLQLLNENFLECFKIKVVESEKSGGENQNCLNKWFTFFKMLSIKHTWVLDSFLNIDHNLIEVWYLNSE